MLHKLPELEYQFDALEPYISLDTLQSHYDVHHRGYVEALNTLLVGSGFENKSIWEIIRYGAGPLYNMAAQHYNHSFYWECIGPSQVYPAILLKSEAAIERNFGSQQAFRAKFQEACVSLFGSGWVWLVMRQDGSLYIEACGNADTPVIDPEVIPLLTCDVWEHAYYLDQRSDRLTYVKNWFSLVDKHKLEERYETGKRFEC